MDKFIDRAKGYIHLARFQPDEIISIRTPIGCKTKKLFTVNEKEYWINMDSERYHTFAKSKKCVCCGIEGTVMCLDHTLNSNPNNPPHFNLYAELNGNLVLMTKDHIIPKNQKGLNHISNYQTMCNTCNELKSDAIISVEKLRQILQDNPTATFAQLRELIKQSCLEKAETSHA